MPEGPELHIAGCFVNTVCFNHIFTGPVVKSAVSTKNPDVPWDEPAYRISATSRGKEVRLTLTATSDAKCKVKPVKTMDILFRFGMSGKFRFDRVDELQKHAHLNFYSSDKKHVLSFVDYRRFGRWEVNSGWGKERGPCVILEYKQFREHVLSKLDAAAFNKPICETLLNQKFFNGIGNYLRAEILHRLKIAPFTRARDVLEPLTQEIKVKSEAPDILELCNILPTQVTKLSGGAGYDPEASEKDYSEFAAWLQCYYRADMKNMVDGNGRTIWFSGPAGPLAPSAGKSRNRKKKTNLDKKRKNKSEASEGEDTSPEKKLTRKALTERKPKEESHVKESKPTSKRKSIKQVENTDFIESKKVKKEIKSVKSKRNGQLKREAKVKRTGSTGSRRSCRIASKDSDST